MPIRESIAHSVELVATKSYSHAYKLHDEKHPSIKKIFYDNWDEFLKDPQVISNGLRDISVKEVNKMI